MKTKGDKIMNKILITAKLGMLALGISAMLSIPHIVLAAHGQAHSDHIRAFSNAAGYLAEKANKEKKQLMSVNKDADGNSQIVIARDERAELPCPQKTDETDNE
jgi:hypothetical protein